MFGWRRKPEGFDWNKYVKTTILVRRQARRDKFDQARDAAAEQVQAAGHAAVRGAKAAGVAAKDGVVKGSGMALKGGVAGVRQAVNAAGRGLDPVGQGIAKGARPLMLTLQRSAVATPLALCGLIALAAGIYRWYKFGLDVEAIAPLVIGVALSMAALPSILPRFGISIPMQPKLGRGVAIASLAIAALAGGTYAAMRGMPSMKSVPTLGSLANFKLPGLSAKPIEGRAAAVAGDVLRLDNKLIRLAGIEAPDRQQSCTRQPGNKKWRCGEQAQAALDKLLRGKPVSCLPAGTDDADRITAKCSVDGRDLAADLVTEGHAFAASSLFGGYAFLEADAKQKKAGVWAGDAERPEAYREKLWDAAKKTAPDGCPIKGRVNTSGAKVYVLPWSGDYASASVRTTKGERWFCSEREAVAAGWRAG
jgi:endonuclease YncB( thermonuclease family)